MAKIIGQCQQGHRITVLGLRLFLATSVGVFMGIQIRLLAYSNHLLFFDPSMADLAPTPNRILNSSELKIAIHNLRNNSPIFLFGHSTGHSGTGTFHESMSQPGCPWKVTVNKFEYMVKEERNLKNETSCFLTQTKLLPRIISRIQSEISLGRRASRRPKMKQYDVDDDDRILLQSESIAMQMEGIDKSGIAFIDLGHFHNGGRTLECLAKELGERSVFIHIRRNRYSIARSFTPTPDDSLSKNEYRAHMKMNRLKEMHRGELDRLPKHLQHRLFRSYEDDDGGDDYDFPRGHRIRHRQWKGNHDNEKSRRSLLQIDYDNLDEKAIKGRPRPAHHTDRTSDRRRRHHDGHYRSRNDEIENSLKSKQQRLPQTPCLAQNVVNGKNVSHPGVAICPRSTEDRGPVNLPISSDEVWDSLSPFQQFLWYADEMEHRWNTLQKLFYGDHTISSDIRRHVPGGHGIPTFIEVTWDSDDELEDGVNWVREQLGCSPAMFLTNKHPHVNHRKAALNCSQFVWEDLDYRKKMKFSSETTEILFPRHLPQHVDSAECSENRAELERRIREYSEFHGISFDPEQWKLPLD